MRRRADGSAAWLSADVAADALGAFMPTFRRCLVARHRLKLGLGTGDHASADGLVDGWLRVLQHAHADYALAFRALAELRWSLDEKQAPLLDAQGKARPAPPAVRQVQRWEGALCRTEASWSKACNAQLDAGGRAER
jgi:uncharacterized protein YdiU (UPF0061 family)